MTVTLAPAVLHAALAADITSDTKDRTLTGLAVPYGPVGHASLGDVTFAQGAIRLPADLGRVKLLEHHNADRSIGYLTAANDTADGLRVTFTIPESPEGDRALTMAADGRRDGLSIGVRLDDDVRAEIIRKWWDEDNTPTAATGELIEVSSVTLPAFDDARVDGSAALAAALAVDVLSAVFRPTPIDRVTAAATTTKGDTMDDTAAGTTTIDATNTTEITAAAPTPSPFAGAAVVTAEAPIYTFDGRGPSFIRDAWLVGTREFGAGDLTAATERFTRFLAQHAASSPAQLHAMLTAAVETRATAPAVIQQGYKPELLISAIDKGRPILSRLQTVGLTDATPYRLPVEGDFFRATIVADAATTANNATITSATAAFTAADLGRSVSGGSIPANAVIIKVTNATTVVLSAAPTATAAGVSLTIRRPGVSDHTEGQAHTAEGDLDVSDVLIQPGAVSGAFRLSRELVDAANPALDAIALRAMLRDYRYVTETKVVAALDAGIDTTLTAINTVLKVRNALASFYDVADEPADFLASGSTFYNTLLADVCLLYTSPSPRD